MPHRHKSITPLDADTIERIALYYVGRYATTRAKLSAYLARKLQERGWRDDRPPDVEGLVARFAERGYVDDEGYAQSKAAALTRRGYGLRRVGEALRAAGIAEADRVDAEEASRAERVSAADRFARKRRIGPYASAPADLAQRQKQLAAFLRAGHDFDMARRFVDAAPGEVIAEEE